jgi:hypothetical protein
MPTGASGWIIKLDARTGSLLGHLDVEGEHVLHGLDLTASGEPVTTSGDELVWFRPAS